VGKLELKYDSFYKFLVSIGTILVTAPFFGIYFLLTGSFDLKLKITEFTALEELSQKLYLSKANLVMQSFSLLPVLLYLLIGLGLFCLIWGCIRWFKVQRYLDASTMLDVAQKLHSLLEMSSEELKAKLLAKIQQIVDTIKAADTDHKKESDRLLQYEAVLQSEGALGALRRGALQYQCGPVTLLPRRMPISFAGEGQYEASGAFLEPPANAKAVNTDQILYNIMRIEDACYRLVSSRLGNRYNVKQNMTLDTAIAMMSKQSQRKAKPILFMKSRIGRSTKRLCSCFQMLRFSCMIPAYTTKIKRTGISSCFCTLRRTARWRSFKKTFWNTIQS